jgi:two-component system, NarL family, sensor histidine kinase DegS
MDKSDPSSGDALAKFQEEIQAESDQTRRALKEVKLMLEQSQAELGKLTQRNTAITGHLQQIQGQFDTIPRPDIRTAYNSALDTQQRLLVMRSQLEKLQSDQTGMQKLLVFLEKTLSLLSEYQPVRGIKGSGSHISGGSAILEKVIDAQEAVRQRLSTQMHDGPAQALSNFMIRVDIASRLLDIDPVKAKEELNNLKVEATRTFSSVKGFITELRPMMLDDLGLFPTVRKYVESFKEQSGIDVNLTIKGQERRLAPYLEVMIFRAVQELIGNVYHHNQDNPIKVVINLQILIEDNRIIVLVSDNGKGFDLETLEKSDGLGLKLIRERVEMLGGTLKIDSSVGQGCKVTFHVPSLETE